MALNPYSKHNRGSIFSQKPQGIATVSDASGLSLESPVTGKKIMLKSIEIDAKDILKSVVKCKYNRRSFAFLSYAAVSDILPSIREAKRNTTPVIAVKLPDGKFEIITGMRRCFAVQLCPDAKLHIHYADSMLEEEKMILARTSDTYRAPSIIDFGLTLLDFKNEVGKDNFNYELATETFGENKTRIGDALNAAKLPDKLLSLFPALEFISRRFLRVMSKKSITDDVILKSIEGLQSIEYSNDAISSDDFEQNIREASSKLEKVILSRIAKLTAAPEETKKSVINDSWANAKMIAGVKAKVTNKNVTITLNSKVANSEEGQRLLKLLSEAE